MESGADVNARGKDGDTPLHDAAIFGRLEVVKLLLDRGADPLAKDHKGRTPAEVARLNGHSGVARLIEEWAKRPKPAPAGELKHIPATQPPLSILEVSQGVLRVGEWGELTVKLGGSGFFTLRVEGDVDCMAEDSYRVDGESSITLYLKPRAAGVLPAKVVVEGGGVKSSKLLQLKVEAGRCPSCGAPQAPEQSTAGTAERSWGRT